MIVIVTGGRKYLDREQVDRALGALHEEEEIGLLIHGNASGADCLCMEWAEKNGVRHKPFDADWKDLTAPGAIIKRGKYGPYNAMAGFARNEKMVEYGAWARERGRNVRVVAFPGGNGTEDMKGRCRRAGFTPEEAEETWPAG